MFGTLRLGYGALTGMVVAYFTVAAWFGKSTVASMLKPDGLTGLIKIWLLFPLLWLFVVSIELARRRVDRPSRALTRLVYRSRHWLLRGLFLIALAIPTARAFGSMKYAIPQIQPFYADPMFIAADRMLFGTDPWRITHALFGPFGTMLIDRAYALWFVEMLLLVAWLNFAKNPKIQLQGLLSYLLVVFLAGNFLATVFASVGPCFFEEFYHETLFVGLTDQLKRTNEIYPLIAFKGMAYLRNSIGTENFGSGISAMPSIHVSMAFLCFLISLKAARSPWIKLALGAYASIILVGSVHLAWHYAVDGLVGIAVVAIIWYASGRFVDWVEARSIRVSAERAAKTAALPAHPTPVSPPSATG